MRELKREAMIDTPEILLYDILQELKQINSKLSPAETVEVKAKTTACKYCGGIHENKGQELACAKKYKKEGAKNDTTD